jgi:hypothetical protein
MAIMGTQETDLSSDSSPESGHRDSDPRKRPFPVGRSMHVAIIRSFSRSTAGIGIEQSSNLIAQELPFGMNGHWGHQSRYAWADWS